MTLPLTIDIAADGHVTAVSVAAPAGHGFDEAAVAAAREMEFFPAEVDGKPSAIRIDYTIHFQPQMVTRPTFDGGDRPMPPARTRRPLTPRPRPPPAAAPAPARVVVRGQIRERGTREPLARRRRRRHSPRGGIERRPTDRPR